MYLNLASWRCEIEMDVAKVFDDLTWADVEIEQDELKAIWEFKSRSWNTRISMQFAVDWRSRGRRTPRRSQCLRRLLVCIIWNKCMVGSRMMWSWLLHHQERSPSSLIVYLTFYFWICSLMDWRNLGMCPTGSNLRQAKHPTINYFGKVSKMTSQATLNYTTTSILRMMRPLVIFTILTTRSLEKASYLMEQFEHGV